MLDYGYSITLILFYTLDYPSILTYVDMHIWTNKTPYGISKNLEIPKRRTILNWGRLYHNKPKMHTFHTNKPKTHICKYPIQPMLHTPIQTMVYTNVIYFCFIHNTHKHRLHLYVLKPYISIHMYHAIEHTIVIYNRLQQLRYVCCIHNPLYVWKQLSIQSTIQSFKTIG